jgi:mono/diheme cytochrome c family protein
MRVPFRRIRLNGFWLYVTVLLAVYLVLRYGVGYFTQWVTGADNPQPVPATLLTAYVVLALLALAVQVGASDKSLRDFWHPLARLLRGPAAGEAVTPLWRAGRYLALVVPPLVVGWAVYQQTAPRVASAATSRQQHPTLPSQYEQMTNPLRSRPPAEQEAAIAEGIVLYEVNCRPCHGTAADGQGTMAAAFQPRPIAFTDAGTIDTIVESYPLWRIETGGPGLPSSSTPWHSAMPAWKDELSSEEIWKIIMAEYDIAGKEPRIPERLE